MKKIESHVQVLIALVLGLCFALLSINLHWPTSFAINYIKPFGTIFLNSLKMIAIPLVFSSLIVGITGIGDTNKLSRIGGRAFLIYIITSILAVIIGISVAKYIKPGQVISEQTRSSLLQLYSVQAEKHTINLPKVNNAGPLQFLINLIPDNIFQALSNNLNLLQVVIVAAILSIALLKVPAEKRRPITLFFGSINSVIIEVVKFIMKLAPIGVFALISSLLIEIAGSNNKEVFEILYALLWYMIAVVIGLSVMTFGVYFIIIRFFTKMNYLTFLKEMRPAQLIAFSTSSSAAALSVTMETVENRLGVSKEISSFVLPLGTTVNMDGTAVYLGVAIIFISQALGINLSLESQILIIVNVTISTLGIGGIPGAAMVATTMLLHSIGVPSIGLALILAPDRILDMCRTVTNITGDAVVTVVVASKEGKINSKVNPSLLSQE